MPLDSIFNIRLTADHWKISPKFLKNRRADEIHLMSVWQYKHDEAVEFSSKSVGIIL